MSEKLKWRKATRVQLIDIAFCDEEAPIHHRQAAIEELKRRSRLLYRRVNYHKKAVYPR
ncbi:hypothetical protein YDYSY3_57520 [Paenibacillus chitinolyticus]|uniref:hypothetical protein n=1 Tax=Paenibacillus chitinolyticus TaxID=79263 RepID=UPI0026E4E335|nr:hypothetical protein [Paenibacillus chitinolyticus]GKS14752.1 hypothetical protein YDYSY3_57520 [Paenibacillus chitinolyticus]